MLVIIVNAFFVYNLILCKNYRIIAEALLLHLNVLYDKRHKLPLHYDSPSAPLECFS